MAFKYVKRSSARAKKTPGESYEAKGTPPAPGEGGRFKALKEALGKKKGVKTPGALSAWIGRKKYTKGKFQAMAAAGRRTKRAIKKAIKGK